MPHTFLFVCTVYELESKIPDEIWQTTVTESSTKPVAAQNPSTLFGGEQCPSALYLEVCNSLSLRRTIHKWVSTVHAASSASTVYLN